MSGAGPGTRRITDPAHLAAARAHAPRPGHRAAPAAATGGGGPRRWPTTTPRSAPAGAWRAGGQLPAGWRWVTDSTPPGATREAADGRKTARPGHYRRDRVPDPGAEGPDAARAVPRLAERARAESWTHEEFLAACLQREVAARESHGGEGRIRAARFPARKSLEDFDFDHARGLKREVIAHLGTLDFVTARDNVVFLGPPGTGKTHLATGLAHPRLPGRAPGRCSPPPPNGSPGSPTPTTPGGCRPSSPGSAATRCWSSTKSATSRSSPRPPTCSSSSSPPGTSGPASSSPATSRSGAGARSSATTSSPPP